MPAQVDDTEFWQAVELMDYWASYPPTHELVAAYLGVKPKPDIAPLPGAQASSDDPSGIGGLMARFPNGFVPADR